MVKVRVEQATYSKGSVDLDHWLEQLAARDRQFDLNRIRQACELSHQAEEKAIQTNTGWLKGRSSYGMGLDMADILLELKVDEDGLIAAIVYRAVRENQITLNHVRKQFGNKVAELVEGVLRMAAISNMQLSRDTPILGEKSDQLEQARRMIVSLVDDVRVALIKLAERTCAIRTVNLNPRDKQEKLAAEIVDIYAPLSHRLGIGHLKWELEDLAFRCLETNTYRQIAALLDGTRTVRQDYIEGVIDNLSSKLRGSGIDSDVLGRAKHIYSIWRKMQEKGIPFSQVYDVRAIRVLVPEVKDCYTALYIVHSLWRTIPHEFDDYIASPKPNGYRSLHTAVIGPEGKVLEVQIRTHEMHEEAEYGVCSHFKYKVGEEDVVLTPRGYEERILWLRQLLERQDEDGDLSLMADDLLSEVSIERIYLYTPEGHVVDMTPGATPIDFAYRVHTEVGHRCRGAKVNGQIVPLNTRLKSGDQVEIMTGDEPEPRREWLHVHLGYVSTSRARSKIQSWFGRRAKEKNVIEGKKLLLTELTYLGIETIDYDMLTAELGFSTADELFTAIGAGDIETHSVIDVIELNADFAPADQQLTLSLLEEEGKVEDRLISGIGELPFELGECCQPVPGDSIIGVMQEDDQSVMIHRQDCIGALKGEVEKRIIRVSWEKEVTRTFTVDLEVQAYDRRGLLYDVTGILFHENNNVLAANVINQESSNQIVLRLTIEVESLNKLVRILEKIERLSNVISAKRRVNR